MIVAGRQASAFCPAHVTGFFKAFAKNSHDSRGGRGYDSGNGGMYDIYTDAEHRAGSTGAGFSLAMGVTTRVRLATRRDSAGGSGAIGDGARAAALHAHCGIPYVITTSGYGADDTRLSDAMLKRFLQAAGLSGSDIPAGVTLELIHEISVPVGYGLGCSGAVALSLGYALNDALCAGMSREEVGRIAHAAEIECKTGLGDVLASYHGGFEVRTSPGAPGVGAVEHVPIGSDVTVLLLCMAPISTSRFIEERLRHVNGLGDEMIAGLRRSKDYEHFEDMSLEFAEHIGVVTPRMRGVIRALHGAGIRCGVALFGETVFCMVRAASSEEAAAQRILAGSRAGHGIVIRSAIDRRGARSLQGDGR